MQTWQFYSLVSSPRAASNWLASEFMDLNYRNIKTPKVPAKYGVACKGNEKWK